MGRVTLRLGGVELQGAQVDNHLVLTAAAFAAVGGEVVAQPATESSDSSASSDGEEREAARANPPRRAESFSSSPCTRRSRSPPPKPLARVPPTPPPPPARSEHQQDRQPDKRKRSRGSRAGEQVKARTVAKAARPALTGSRGGERQGPFQQSASSNSGLFGQPPHPSPSCALGTVLAPAASRRTDLHDPALLPQVSASPFFLQPVPRVLPPWLPSRRRHLSELRPPDRRQRQVR